MQIIEWAFSTLSFIAFYFFVSKNASKPSFRMIGLILSLIIGALMIIFCFSIGVTSLAFLNVCYLFLNSYGILNCIKEIKSNKIEVI